MTVRMNSKSMKAGVSALAILIGAAWAAEAYAQASDVEEVVVTARKREENLQDIPLSISAFNSEELEKQGTANLENLSAATPGLAFQSLGGTYQAPVIRGLAQVDQTAAIGNVGVFVDGVYINNRSGQEFGFMDLERIEVVKGPQSALYGQNTFSGAINYISKAPYLHDFGGSVTAEVGNYGRKSLQGSLNVPLGDIAAIRLFGGRGKFDGTIKNTRTGNNLNGWDNHSTYGVSLLVKPTDKLTARAFYMRSDSKNDQAAFVFIPSIQNNCGSFVAVTPSGPRNTLYCGKLPVPTSVDLNDDPAHGLHGFNALGYASVDYDLGFAVLSGTFGYTNARFAQLNDQTADRNAINLPLPTNPLFSQQVFLEAVGQGSHERSFDLKLTSPGDDRFRYVVGIYAYESFNDDTLSSFNTRLGDYNSRVLSFGRGGLMNIYGRAIYGSADFDVTEKFTLSAEARHTRENQKFRLVTATSTLNGQQHYKYTTPRFTATYKLNEDTNVYASMARGLKIGGFNSNAFGLPQFTYGPETNWTYEAGVKTALLDHKLVVDASIYYIDWKNIQVQSNIPSSNTAIVINNKGATSYGVEMTATYNFTPDFWVRASVTKLNPTYKDGTRDGEVFAPCGEIIGSTVTVKGCSSLVGGNQLARTTKLQASVSADYTIPNVIGDFDLYLRGDASYQEGKHYLSLGNDDQGDIKLVNTRIGLHSEKIDVAFWVNNLFDYKYLARSTSTASGVQDGQPLSGVLATRLYPGERRTIGVRASYNF